jgi:hypothetical protein
LTTKPPSFSSLTKTTQKQATKQTQFAKDNKTPANPRLKPLQVATTNQQRTPQPDSKTVYSDKLLRR